MKQRLFPFLLAQGVLYAAFLWLDLFRPGATLSTYLKYLSILLCFCLLLCRQQNRDGMLTRAALGFTLLADFFLLVLDRWYGAGVSAFCVVQLIYLARIHRAGRRPLALRLVIRAALTALLLTVAGALGALNCLTALTLVYFSQLAANFFASLSLGRRGRLFSLGLLLFIGCDLCVGLCNLSPVLPDASVLVLLPFARVGMWLFYLPSQVLITLSAGKLCD